MRKIATSRSGKLRLNHGGINLLPIILIAVIIYMVVKVDLKSVFESEQLKKNVNYVKSYFDANVGKYSTEIGDKFLQTQPKQNTNKTGTFNFSSFFPQINNKIINPNNNTLETNNFIQEETTSTSNDVAGFRTLP